MTLRLRAAGCVFAEDEAALLLQAGLPDAHREELVRRRVAGEPLEHLLGWVEFDGLRLQVGPGVFVPRHRTELVVASAVQRLPEDGWLLDLCCGCGAIGAAVAARVEAAEVVATDRDAQAVQYATRNLNQVRPGRPGGAWTFVGDLFDGLPSHLRGRFDVIAVNAPYVPTAELAFLPAEAREHEPVDALDGGVDGVHWHRRIAAEARTWLCESACVVIETSAGSVELTRTAFTEAGFRTEVRTDPDLEATVVVASPDR